MSKTVAIVGISGVGKSSFAKRLSCLVNVEIVGASNLIRSILEASTGTKWTSEDMRNADTDRMQEALIDGFENLRKQVGIPLILDAHTIIDKGTYLERVKPSFFQRLGIDLILNLRADPTELVERRHNDLKRIRPELSVDEISRHQKESTESAIAIGVALGVPCVNVSNEDINSVAKMLYPQFEKSLSFGVSVVI